MTIPTNHKPSYNLINKKFRRYKVKHLYLLFCTLRKRRKKTMQKELLTELEDLRDETEFILNNEDIVEDKHIENYLRSLERIRYNIFNKIKLKEKYEISENEKIDYLNNNYKVDLNNDILKIYVPEVLPKYKNLNNFAYKNIMLNVMEKTKEYKNLFNTELVCVFINVVENQKNMDIDNKFVKPIVDGLVHSGVIADDNTSNMFYTVLGTTNTSKKPYTEVYVFRGEILLRLIKNLVKKDIPNISTFDNF